MNKNTIFSCFFMNILVLNSFANDASYLIRNKNKFLEEENGVSLFENPRTKAITSMQFQFFGKISEVTLAFDKNEFFINFNGKVHFYVTGAEAFNPKTNPKQLEWNVVALPLKIKRWEMSGNEIQPWANNSLSFDSAFQKCKQAKTAKSNIKIALKGMKVIFAESGELIGIEGEQMIIESVEHL